MKKIISCAVLSLLVLLGTTLAGHAGGSRVVVSGGGVWVGPGWGWGWGWGVRPWWGWGPGWWGPAVPFSVAPPIVVQQSPPVFVQPAPQAQEQFFWYYCQNPQGYFPYVRECPNGWMRVVPSPTPPPR